MKNYGKLDQLTALRFFAALMIVIHHSADIFGIKAAGVNWGQGVSFFFVLSGFILAYVYPRLDSKPEVLRFWRARVARIWPAYLFCFALGILLVRYPWDTTTALANLLMIQAWIPLSSFYFSYNAVSWSISTEALFYLAFPLLIYRWTDYWRMKLIGTAIFLVFLIYVTNSFDLPAYGDPNSVSSGRLVTQHGLIYINPMSRIFEFVLGMATAALWLKKGWTSAPASRATIFEIAALLLCAASMAYSNNIAHFVQQTAFGSAGALWVVHSGSCFSFALLIFVMATGAGRVSGGILASPLFVLLGEISFSLYLIHQILLNMFSQSPLLLHFPAAVSMTVFAGILLASSYLIWVLVEMPGRRLLLGQGTIHGTSTMQRDWNRHAPLGRNSALVGTALVALLAISQFAPKQEVEPPSCCGSALLPLTEKNGALLYSLISSKNLGDQTGNISIEGNSIHIHPGVSTTTTVEFWLDGSLSRMTYKPLISRLDKEGEAQPLAGVVGFEVVVDGRPQGRMIVDRGTDAETTLDLRGARRVEFRVDNGNATPAWDWFMVNVISLK
jgi:peptidoglycan/LPS O-acetylase OafA/YrhL